MVEVDGRFQVKLADRERIARIFLYNFPGSINYKLPCWLYKPLRRWLELPASPT
jgi:hypothetical protein